MRETERCVIGCATIVVIVTFTTTTATGIDITFLVLVFLISIPTVHLVFSMRSRIGEFLGWIAGAVQVALDVVVYGFHELVYFMGGRGWYNA